MPGTASLVLALKAELRRSKMTYADLARRLGLAESSVKRMFSKGDMPLSRVDAICSALKLDFAELARRVVDAGTSEPQQLTLAQERAVVADPRLLLVAICCLSLWPAEEIVSTYRLTEAECIRHLARLDRLGIIELRPGNQYRLMMSRSGLRWRPDGPVMQFFRQRVAPEFFAGGFDGEGEWLTLLHGSLAREHVLALQERLQRVAQDFAQLQLQDQRLPAGRREGVTLVVGLRAWFFSAFEALLREGRSARR